MVLSLLPFLYRQFRVSKRVPIYYNVSQCLRRINVSMIMPMMVNQKIDFSTCNWIGFFEKLYVHISYIFDRFGLKGAIYHCHGTSCMCMRVF